MIATHEENQCPKENPRETEKRVCNVNTRVKSQHAEGKIGREQKVVVRPGRSVEMRGDFSLCDVDHIE